MNNCQMLYDHYRMYNDDMSLPDMASIVSSVRAGQRISTHKKAGSVAGTVRSIHAP
jgi:hypothetical protein